MQSVISGGEEVELAGRRALAPARARPGEERTATVGAAQRSPK
jgi:hypothetical protein